MTTQPIETDPKILDEIASLVVGMGKKIEAEFTQIKGAEIARIFVHTGVARICTEHGRDDTLTMLEELSRKMLDGTSGIPGCEAPERPNKMPAEITQQSAEAVHKIFKDSMAALGEKMEREFPQYAALLPRTFIWVGAQKIGLDAGHDTAADVLEEMAGAIRGGALDPDAPDVPPGPRLLQ